MISAFIVFALLLTASFSLAGRLTRLYPGTSLTVFRNIILLHILLSIVYYIYGSLTATDSLTYYAVVEYDVRGFTWGEYYGVSTQFIEFIAYPFIKFLGMSYAAMMILFSWFGLMGFFLFYIFLKEHIRYDHSLFGFNLLHIIVYLPNLHFWSSSLGKGSVIFLGFGLLFYSLNKVGTRLLALIVGAVIIYHVRPHIMFVVLAACVIGFVFSTKDINWVWRTVVVMLGIGAFYYIYQDVLSLTGIDEDNLLNDATGLSVRSKDLMKANSGVDISGYSFPMKLFTFWFRPLFIDAPGFMGLVVSFENLLYLYLFFRLFNVEFIRFISLGGPIVKAAMISFLGVSAALAQVSANLGLAMRQKSQVMILAMFVILKFLDEQKAVQVRIAKKRKKLREQRLAKTLAVNA